MPYVADRMSALRYSCPSSLWAAADGHESQSALVCGLIGKPWTARAPAGDGTPGPRVVVAAAEDWFAAFTWRKRIDQMKQAPWKTPKLLGFEGLDQRPGNLEVLSQTEAGSFLRPS